MAVARLVCDHARPRRDRQVGAAAVTSLIFLMVMAAFLALSLNMGLLMDTYTELQVGSDAAALAAAKSLDGTTVGLGNARNAAVEYSDEHVAYGERLIVDPMSDVIFGRWHFTAGACIASGGNCARGFEPYSNAFAFANPGRVTAVRLRNGRDGGSHNPVIELPFGAFVGTPTGAVRSSAVAVGPGSSTSPCALPFGVAVCKLRDSPDSTELHCPQQLFFSNELNDAIGFVNFEGDAAGGHDAAQTINSGLCNGGVASLGEVRVQNGNDFNQQVINALQGQSTGVCLIGSQQIMPVINAGCEASTWGDADFNRTSEIVGFVRVTITAVTDQSGTVMGCPDQPAPNVTSPGRRAVIFDVDCTMEPTPPGALGGGEYFNSTGARVRLVE
jgi:hypothetical protein